jgi:hydroxymethylpyrimidine/phosphomethylpyrimidine kinase
MSIFRRDICLPFSMSMCKILHEDEDPPHPCPLPCGERIEVRGLWLEMIMTAQKIKTVFTIAGSDPTGGAGIQADLRTLNTLGVRGLSVISAITAQDSAGVRGSFPVDPDVFSLQLETILKDFKVDAVKTGMLLTAENVRITADLLRRFPIPILVIDPVITSSSGVPLLEEEGIGVMIEELLPMAAVVTPNLPEARALSGMALAEGKEEDAWIRGMCKAIYALGPQSVIITGGHRAGDPSDLLYHREEFALFSSPRIASDLHGSGCIFSSALCGNLALGLSMSEALVQAKQFTLTRILHE